MLKLDRDKKSEGENRGETGGSFVTTGRVATLQWVELVT